MAFTFYKNREKLLYDGKTIIAVTELIGNTAAGLFYSKNGMFILTIAIGVFFLNMKYMIASFNEKRKVLEGSAAKNDF